jgi:hypothetical protein
MTKKRFGKRTTRRSLTRVVRINATTYKHCERMAKEWGWKNVSHYIENNIRHAQRAGQVQ